MVLICFSCGLKLHLLGGVFYTEAKNWGRISSAICYLQPGRALFLMLSLVLPQKLIARHEGCAGGCGMGSPPCRALSWMWGGCKLEGCLLQGLQGSCALPPSSSSSSHLVLGAQACQCLCLFFKCRFEYKPWALLGGFWGAISFLLSRQPDECWGPGSCLMGSCCIRGAGEAFGFLCMVYTPRVLCSWQDSCDLSKCLSPVQSVISWATPEGPARVCREMVSSSSAAPPALWRGSGGRVCRHPSLWAAGAALTPRDHGQGVILLAGDMLGGRHEQKAWLALIPKEMYGLGVMEKTRNITPWHCSKAEDQNSLFHWSSRSV